MIEAARLERIEFLVLTKILSSCPWQFQIGVPGASFEFADNFLILNNLAIQSALILIHILV